MSKNTGGPVFPSGSHDRGMTLRDYFAAKAMQEMVNEYDDFDFMAQTAYAMADAMLKAREKGGAA